MLLGRQANPDNLSPVFQKQRIQINNKTVGYDFRADYISLKNTTLKPQISNYFLAPQALCSPELIKHLNSSSNYLLVFISSEITHEFKKPKLEIVVSSQRPEPSKNQTSSQTETGPNSPPAPDNNKIINPETVWLQCLDYLDNPLIILHLDDSHQNIDFDKLNNLQIGGLITEDFPCNSSLINLLNRQRHLWYLNFTRNKNGEEFINRITNLGKLKYLRLAQIKFKTNLAPLLKKTPRLVSLQLPNTGINDQVIKPVAAMKNLRRLNLKFTDISDKSLETISKLETLEVLNLSYLSNITNRGMENLTGLKNLKQLILENTPINEKGLYEIKNLPHLENINLSYSNLSIRAFDYFLEYPRLSVLVLDNNSLDLEKLKLISRLTKLEYLSLEAVNFKIKWLPWLSKLNNLRRLNLGNNFHSAVQLNSTFTTGSLRVLNLNHNKITGPLLDLFASAQKILSLNLQAATLTIKACKTINKFKFLKQLDLSSTSINDNCLLQLQSLPLLNLLDLSSNPVNLEKLDLEKVFPNLKELHLNDTMVKCSQINKIEKAMPELVIIGTACKIKEETYDKLP